MVSSRLAPLPVSIAAILLPITILLLSGAILLSGFFSRESAVNHIELWALEHFNVELLRPTDS